MFDSNVLHIAEFMTVAKSLPHLWQKVRKLLIPKLFLSYSCIFTKNRYICNLIDMKTDRLKIIFLLCSLWLVLPCFCLAAKGKDFIVVIDPGHGGHDPGAIGRRGKEKNINLNVALKVGQLIQNNCNDVKVIYTRKTDVFIP